MKTRMNNFGFLFVLLYQIVCVFMLNYMDVGSVRFSYAVSSFDLCRTNHDRFRFVQGYSITDCVMECNLRPHCKALSLSLRKIGVCELFSSAEDTALSAGNCVYVKRSDIQVVQSPEELLVPEPYHIPRVSAGVITREDIPCRGCQYSETCEQSSKTCKITECVNITTPENGKIMGNRKGIGNIIRYKCDKGYRERNGITTATCLDDGTWSETADCIKDCTEPLIQNAIISNGGILVGSIRRVTCTNGTTVDLNKTESTIQCTRTGSWSPDTTCSKYNNIVFRVLPGNGHSSVEAWMNGTDTNSDTTCRNVTESNCTTHYRDPRIDDWESYNIQKVRYSIFKDGAEVAWMLFNGTGSSIGDWFQQYRIIDSSYSDLSPTSTLNFFGIEPPVGSQHRKFYASVSFKSCEGDTLYFVTIDQEGVCWYDNHESYPTIIYSLFNTSANTSNEDNFGRGDTAVVSLYN